MSTSCVGCLLAVLALCGSACNAVQDLSAEANVSERDRLAAITMVTRREQAPAWAVAYGAEFWRRTISSASGVTASRSSAIDVGGVIDRVSHAIAREDSDSLPRAVSSTYTAAFDGRGLRFSPTPPSLSDSVTEAQLRTSRVQVGDRDVYRDDGRVLAWSILGNTAQALLGSVVEHHEARGDGVELSWVLAERPAAGDLVVELGVDGLVYGGQTARGAHFVDTSGVARMRIGTAELVDAGGRRWPVATDVLDGRLRWRVPAEILAAATFPVALDPIVGPELGIDEPVVVMSPNDDTGPEIAFNGERYLVVWGVNPLGTSDIHGARVTTSGQVEDPYGIVISSANDDQWSPVVASNGTDFLVAWEDSRGTGWAIYATRVNSAGAVVDPAGIKISGVFNATNAAVASDGTDYFIAWVGNSDIYGARVTAAGVVPAADANGIPISVENGDQIQPAVASNGSGYVVVWSDRRGGSSAKSNIYAARVTAAGAVPVSDTHGIPISTFAGDKQTPSIASNGTDYLVTWSDRRAPEFDVYGARFTAAGTVLAADVNGIPIATGAARQGAPKTASNGTDYFVVWFHNDRAVFGARVTAAGQVPTSDASGILIAPETSTNPYPDGYPSVASDGADYLVAWTEDAKYGPAADVGAGDVFVARVNATGVVQDPGGVLVSTAANTQATPSVASNGAGFLVAWSEDRQIGGTRSDIYGARVSPTGAIEDVAPIEISRAADDQWYPVVASNGADYFVAWSVWRNYAAVAVVGARVTAGGEVPAADGAGIAITTVPPYGPLAVASNGTDYLVAWSAPGGATSYDLFGARVTAAGSVPVADAAGIAISTAPDLQYEPSIASNGTDYLVAWTDARNGANHDIYGARVAAAGTVTDPAGIAISTAPRKQFGASVVSNGTDYFVAWTDERMGYDIYGARVTSAGTIPPSDAAGIGMVTGLAAVAREPSVAFNGADYFLTWVSWTDYVGGNGVISGKPVTQAGSASTTVAIGTATDAQSSLRIAGYPGLPYLVTYLARSRVAARLITSCGNAVVDADETCDDRNSTPGDGCSNTCAIEPGYTCAGSPSTCSDVNECAVDNGGCAHLCSNTPGSFACGCMQGYTLNADGFGCDDIDECTMNNGGCAAGVSCTNLPGSRACGDCPPGYTGDGVTCTDIDECSTSNGDCAQTCTNTAGSYTCSCMAGYTLDADGHKCNDLDECAMNNGGCSIDPPVTCTNTPGSFTCGECPAGFSGTGTTCLDIDECARGEDDCAPTAHCTNTVGGFTCACVDGFVGDGRTCEEETSTSEPGGCGCSTGGSRDASLVILALAYVTGRRRRRRT